MQELIAPEYLIFLQNDWTVLGTKLDLYEELSGIAGVPRLALVDRHAVRHYCAAERMRWASKRKTTRSEDLAYCLLGIFGVHIPLLYGEGQTAAFHRLQEAIMQKTTDHSLLAWDTELRPARGRRAILERSESSTFASQSLGLLNIKLDPRVRNFRPVMAPSPIYFSVDRGLQAGVSKSGAVHPSRMTNKGLEITLPIRRQRGSDDLYHARLLCSHKGEAVIVTLRLLGPFDNRFARIEAPLMFEPGTDFIRPKTSPGPPFFASLRTLEDLPIVSYLLGFMMRSRWEQTTIFIVQELSIGDYRPLSTPHEATRFEVPIETELDGDDLSVNRLNAEQRAFRTIPHLESWEFATRRELFAFLMCSWLIMQGQYKRSDGLGVPLVGLNLAFLPVWVLNHHMHGFHAPTQSSRFVSISHNTRFVLKIVGLGLVYIFLDLIVDDYMPTLKTYTRLVNICARPFAFLIWQPRPTRSTTINLVTFTVRVLGTIQLLCEVWQNRCQYQQIFNMSVGWVAKIDDALGAWTDSRHILLLQMYCSTLIHQLQIDRQTRSGAWPVSVIITFTLTNLLAYPELIHFAVGKNLRLFR